MLEISKAIVQNESGEILVIRRNEEGDSFTSGKWELPGGKIKPEEDRFESAVREIKEETNLAVKGGKDVVRIEIEETHHVNCYIVYFDSFSGEIDLQDTHSDYRWISSEEATDIEWHPDSEYDIVPIHHLEFYLSKDKNY